MYCAFTEPSVPNCTDDSSAPDEPFVTGMSIELTWSNWVNECVASPSWIVMFCGAAEPKRDAGERDRRAAR